MRAINFLIDKISAKIEIELLSESMPHPNRSNGSPILHMCPMIFDGICIHSEFVFARFVAFKTHDTKIGKQTGTAKYERTYGGQWIFTQRIRNFGHLMKMRFHCCKIKLIYSKRPHLNACTDSRRFSPRILFKHDKKKK